MNRNTKRTIIVPMDHGVTNGPIPGLIDISQAVNLVAEGGANAVIGHMGLALYGHRQRGTFLRDSGVSLSDKTIARLERGERDSYPDATISMIEKIYHWKPGSVEAVLRGGEPALAETQREPARRYADSRLQRIWEITDLPESVRLGMIAFAQSVLGSAGEDHDDRLAG